AITLVDEACVALDIFDDRADVLRQLARFIVERDH
ncbi:MAG TPA: farnesyl-diphosphate synthase, partial [Planctomycetaceae bacterium]|nr:farnesyl-diphosphate synthase [Planctomycetaceae bacterium]